MALVYLALGSNLGDRRRYLNAMANGIRHIDRTQLLERSALWSSPPWKMKSQWDFLNACVLIDTLLEPTELLVRTRKVERQLGRMPGSHQADRTADIDILWWEGLQMKGPTLTIPHPELFERDFVLLPLREIVIEEHAELRKAIDEALDNIKITAQKIRDDRDDRDEDERYSQETRP